MDLKGILTIATYPGLYKHVAQAVNGIIVESVADGNRTIAFATAKISALEDISIYTTDGDTRLSDVYRSLYKVLDGNARIGAIVDFLNGDTLRHPNSDMDQLSLWELGGLGGRVIERRLSEAVFSVSYIMPGTGDKEFETIAQFLRPWQ